jgi:hypothetical protein
MRHLPVLTNSSITTFRRCLREYQFAYVMARRSRRTSFALIFGTIMHRALNAWWTYDSTDLEMRMIVSLRAIRSASEGVDPYEIVKAETLMAGYTARWGAEPYETIAVERNFQMPIHAGPNVWGHAHPEPSATLSGSIDAIVRSKRSGRPIYNVEHKTTSSDISPTSDYWRIRDALDPQVSTYDAASRSMGFDIRGTIYDAIRKPEFVPLKATPEETKKYTKPTKAEPVPRLYAGQRETDETPEEYRQRLTEDICKRPEWYYARRTIVRLEHDNEAHAIDVVHTAEMIKFAASRDAWPRNPGSGETTIDDGTRYVNKSSQHEELESP